jgi:hypothetical protein
LRATGTIVKGNQSGGTFSSAAGAFNFTGNPYVAPVNMQTILNGATNINSQFYYIWDPTRSTRGAYVTVDVQSNTNNVSGSAANKYLQPGQACFVVTQSNGSASLTYTESSKATISDETSVFKTNGSGYPEMTMNLYLTDSLPSNPPPQDGLVIRYDPSFDNGFDVKDALKPGNQDEDLGIDILSGTTLSFESRKIPVDGDSSRIYFHQNQNPSATIGYTLKITLDNITGLEATLYDRYTKAETPIVKGNITSYAFSVDQSLAGSKAFNRLVIYYKKASGIQASSKDHTIKIYPDPATTRNIQIESGLAGKDTKIDIVDASGKIQYSEMLYKTEDKILLHLPDNLKPGIYFLKIMSADGSAGRKFIIE